MVDNWIGRILLTGEDEVSVGGEKVHDIIELNEVGGVVVPVDKVTHPVLWSKLGGVTTGDIINLPNMKRQTGSPHPYKIIADKTN